MPSDRRSAVLLEVPHGHGDLALRVTLGECLTTVVLLATAGEGDLDFGAAIFEVHLERHDGQWLCLGLDPPLVDLVAMDEELPFPIWVVTPESNGVAPRWDVGGEQPELTVVDPGVALGDLRLAFSQRLHFTAGEHQAAFEGIDDLIVMPGAPIRGDHTVAVYVRPCVGATFLDLFGSCHVSSVVTSVSPISGR